MSVRVKAAGHLRYRMPEKQTELRVDVEPQSSVSDLLGRLGLNKAQVWIIRVNGQNVPPEHPLTNDDVVELFPLVGGG